MRKVNPAAKNANRAFVRLHTYVSKQFDWDSFTKNYRVVLNTAEDGGVTLGGFKPEVQHLQPSKVRRCHHLVRPRPINNFSLKSASPLPV